MQKKKIMNSRQNILRIKSFHTKSKMIYKDDLEKVTQFPYLLGHSVYFRLCLCSDEPLCNERFKDQPGGAGYILLNPLFVPTLIIVWILSAMQ